MRSPDQMMALILRVARKDDRIRAIDMHGSHLNPQVKPERRQGATVIDVITGARSFVANSVWGNDFGERIIVEEPDRAATA